MARSNHLSRADFPSSVATRRASNELFSAAVWPLTQGLEPKFACVVSKKVARKAVDRNRLKRRCRAAGAALLPSLIEPLVIVIYPKIGVLTVSFTELRRSLEALLVKMQRKVPSR